MGFNNERIGFVDQGYWNDVAPREVLLNPSGVAVAPTVDSDGFITFPDNAWAVAVFRFQVPHNWVIGSSYNFHVHGKKVTAAAGAMDLKMMYQEIPIGAAQPAYTTLVNVVEKIGTLDTVNHGIWSYTITPSASLGMSSIINVWFERDARVANVNDTYAGTFKLYDADLHMYLLNQNGSKNEYSQ